MSFEEAKFWTVVAFQVVNAIATSGMWLYVRYGDRNKEVDRKFAMLSEEFDRRADEHDRRLSRVEGSLERAPTHEDLGALHDKVNLTAQGVAKIGGQLDAMNDNLRLILNRIAEKGMP